MSELEVTVPEGVGPGTLITISAPDGNSFDVTVPDGVVPGEIFRVQLESEPSPPPPPQEALQMTGLSEAQMVVLRACLLAIEDSKALDEYVNTVCDSFGEYVEEREQKLEWQTLYNEYVARIERIIEETLQQHGATSADLFELLKAARQDRKANIFLDRFLAIESYDEFCFVRRCQRSLAVTIRARRLRCACACCGAAVHGSVVYPHHVAATTCE